MRGGFGLPALHARRGCPRRRREPPEPIARPRSSAARAASRSSGESAKREIVVRGEIDARAGNERADGDASRRARRGGGYESRGSARGLFSGGGSRKARLALRSRFVPSPSTACQAGARDKLKVEGTFHAGKCLDFARHKRDMGFLPPVTQPHPQRARRGAFDQACAGVGGLDARVGEIFGAQVEARGPP
jgi:hypothetical protein